MPDTDEFDYIVIGGGSAGAPVAARLSESGRHRVLLLEAGPRRSPLWVRTPIGYVFYLDRPSSHNWGFRTEPEQTLQGRVINAPRGKGVGGTSLINSMMYVRGAPFDYDGWRDAGAVGWAYDDVLPFFKKAERHVWGETAFHGGEGPLEVRGPQSTSPIHEAMIAAGQELGFPVTEDFNGRIYEGFGRYHHNQFLSNGLRCSTGASYLREDAIPKNLLIKDLAHVSKIEIENGRAVGVRYRWRDGACQSSCRGEVVLCAGAFQSPQIMMLSGIGPSVELTRHGINVHLDQGDVGTNLMDHFGADIQCTASKPVTLYSAMKIPGALTALYQMLFQGKGPYTFFPFDSGAMVRSDPGEDKPDLQLLCGDYTREGGRKTMRRHGFNIAWCQSRPKSRGTVSLQSNDPFASPSIRYGFLSEEEDRFVQRRAFRLARGLTKSKAFAAYFDEEIAPGKDCASDDAIDDYVASHGGQHHHPCGTLKMGPQGKGVVDHRLKVHGVDRLRVADASIMPNIVSGNTNAPTIMIGEKAASMILEDAP
ncbi:MAG: GMC family oxidoreductase N-terminal domain-containing protein [Pseudomonadota bacterium]